MRLLSYDCELLFSGHVPFVPELEGPGARHKFPIVIEFIARVEFFSHMYGTVIFLAILRWRIRWIVQSRARENVYDVK